MRHALVFVTVAVVSLSCSALLFSDAGAVLFFTLSATVTAIVLIRGEFNIARFGAPQIIRRGASPLAYWAGIGVLAVLVVLVLIAGPKGEPSVFRKAFVRFIKSA